MRRVDRRTNALPDQPTDQPTDTASYRGALSHLKIDKWNNIPHYSEVLFSHFAIFPSQVYGREASLEITDYSIAMAGKFICQVVEYYSIYQ